MKRMHEKKLHINDQGHVITRIDYRRNIKIRRVKYIVLTQLFIPYTCTNIIILYLV